MYTASKNHYMDWRRRLGRWEFFSNAPSLIGIIMNTYGYLLLNYDPQRNYLYTGCLRRRYMYLGQQRTINLDCHPRNFAVIWITRGRKFRKFLQNIYWWLRWVCENSPQLAYWPNSTSFPINDGWPIKTPFPPEKDLSETQYGLDVHKENETEKMPYQQLVGCLFHLRNTTHPDVR